MESDSPFATNEEIARILFQMASLFDLFEENPYRVRAYRRAALGVLLLPKPLVEYVAQGEDMPLRGVGDHLRGRLRDVVNTGKMGVYESLLEDLGEPFASLLAVQGVGPKTAIRLVRELGIDSLQSLADAAHSGKIRALHGFGSRREAEIGRQAEAVLSQHLAA